VVVIDLIPERLEKARRIGADAVVDASAEDVVARLTDLHGGGESMFPGKAGTDIYLDAAGARNVVETALAAAKKGATIGIVGVHKEQVPVEFVNVMSNELTIVGSMGYPDEIFEVTKDLVANWEKYALIVSHTVSFADVHGALTLAATPGAADKVVVVFPWGTCKPRPRPGGVLACQRPANGVGTRSGWPTSCAPKGSASPNYPAGETAATAISRTSAA
jgi:threonine dehydrogenase-like Zn-dependent dehydrogenase